MFDKVNGLLMLLSSTILGVGIGAFIVENTSIPTVWIGSITPICIMVSGLLTIVSAFRAERHSEAETQ